MENESKNPCFGTDLAAERRRADVTYRGVEMREEEIGALRWERIRITDPAGAEAIGRPMGRYHTLQLPRMDEAESDVLDHATEELTDELLALCDGALSHFPARLLVVGLGNAALTADAIGSKSAHKVHPTMQLRTIDEGLFRALDCAEIAVMIPGVTAQSGMDAAQTVAAVCRQTHPELVIAIDSLAARATARLGTTVQLSDTGIAPGSGVCNHRHPLRAETLGAPVIAIGVPTVTDARVFFHEEAKRRGLDAEERGGEPLFVSPRGIEEIVEVGSELIAAAINRAFGALTHGGIRR